MEYEDPRMYIPFIFLLYSWGSLFGVSSKVPLMKYLLRANFSDSTFANVSEVRPLDPGEIPMYP